MKEYTTGNARVDLMTQIQLTGNVTPQMWYKTITRENGKPHLLAIAILSDIVYWYRPVEIRDESTGQLMGYRKKFRADMLQRSYDQFAEQFGESKRSVTDAVVRLEKLGVVRREFRTLEVGGMRYNNVLFIDLFPEQLCRLTYPEQYSEPEPEAACQDPVPEFCDRGPADEDTLSRNSVGGVPGFCGGCPEIPWEGSQNFVTQNTKNTTENTTKISSSSSSPPAIPGGDDDDTGGTALQIQECHDTAIREGYAPEIVDAVAAELERYREPLTPSMFTEICRNISRHVSGDIGNMPAYIQKCIANRVLMQKLAEANAARRTRAGSDFLRQGYGVPDWNAFEQSILSN